MKKGVLFWVMSVIVAATVHFHCALALTQDGLILLEMKSVLNDSRNVLSNWRDSDELPYNWTGVTCHPEDQRVSSINLPYMQLGGTISPNIGNSNSLHGFIPNEIARCAELRALYLRANYLQGGLPSDIGNLSALTILDISSNLLKGAIPSSVSRLSRLRSRNLSTNFFSGEIPNVGVLSNFGDQSCTRVNEPLKLHGKVAIVRGGASGIGEATVRLFAAHSASTIIIADIQDDLDTKLAESIGHDNCSYVHCVHCDVADEQQVQSLVESTVRKFGRLYIMFSNAGILSPEDQKILDLDFTSFDRLFDVNVRGMTLCVKHAAREMVEGRVRGSIVCTASVRGSHGMKKSTDYCMSKHAVLGLMRSASVQLGVHGIRVNCVSPNGMATPLTCKASGVEMEELQRVYMKFARLRGVVLTAEHVANAVLFLASDEAEFVTGHDFVVDGSFVSMCPSLFCSLSKPNC